MRSRNGAALGRVVLVLLASGTLAACTSGDVVIDLGAPAARTSYAEAAARSSQPSCDCSSLPQPDPRIPWDENWTSVSFSADGRFAALTGSNASHRLSDVVLDLASDPSSAIPIGPPAELDAREDGFGAWSPDGRFFAEKASEPEAEQWDRLRDSCLAIFDARQGEWSAKLRFDSRCSSNPAWSSDSRFVAMVVRGPHLAGAPPVRAGAVPPPGQHVPAPPARVVVCDSSGQLLRTALFSCEDVTYGERPILSWSPDDRFLVILTTEAGIFHPELRILDAASLATVEQHPDPDLNFSAGLRAAPQWSAVTHEMAIPTYGGIGLLTLRDDGHLASQRILRRSHGVDQLAWCPDGQHLLSFEQEEIHDLVDFLDALKMQDCSNGQALHKGQARFIDAATGAAVDCPDTAQSRRELRWRSPWPFPRVAEAFALWTR